MAQTPFDWMQALGAQLPPGLASLYAQPQPLTLAAQQGLPPAPIPAGAPPTFSAPSAYMPAPQAAPAPGPMAPQVGDKSFLDKLRGAVTGGREEMRNAEQAESFRAPTPPDIVARQFGYTDPVAEAAAVKATTDAKTDMTDYMKIITEGLAPKATSLTIPGAGKTGLPAPRLPALPDFSAARANMKASAPVPIERAGDAERLSGILGAGAQAGAKGSKVGEILALAGGAMAGQHSAYKGESRKLADTENERQRSFNRDMANFEVMEAKTKYEHEWQRSTLQYQHAMKQWEVMQPKIQLTENGVITMTNDGKGGQKIEMVPWSSLDASNVAGKNARKGAGLIGGQAFLKEMSARIAAAPGFAGKQMAIASGIVTHLTRSGLLVLPGGETDETQKKAVFQSNQRLFGTLDSRKIIEDAQRRAGVITQGMGLNQGSKEYAEKYSQNFSNTLGAFLIENPILMKRWMGLTFGTTGQ